MQRTNIAGLRDALLPNLLSGEIDLGAAEEATGGPFPILPNSSWPTVAGAHAPFQIVDNR